MAKTLLIAVVAAVVVALAVLTIQSQFESLQDVDPTLLGGVTGGIVGAIVAGTVGRKKRA